MYISKVKHILNTAMKTTFDSQYIEEDFRDLYVSVEFPIKETDYPGIWTNFNPRGDLERAGVSHEEVDSEDGLGRTYTRWVFQGEASYSCAALSSYERDRLYDEMIRTVAFGEEATSTSRFREIIETNDFIGMSVNFDSITTRGFGESMGTPWQTDQWVYEAEIVLSCVGEFVADTQTFDLAPLDVLRVYPYTEEDIVEGFVEGTQIGGDSLGDLEIPLDDEDDGKGVWI